MENVFQYARRLLQFTNASISDASRILNSFRLAWMRDIHPDFFVFWAEEVLNSLRTHINQGAMSDEVERLAALEEVGSEDIRYTLGAYCSHLWTGWDKASVMPAADLDRFIRLLLGAWGGVTLERFQELLEGFQKLSRTSRDRVLNSQVINLVRGGYVDHDELNLAIQEAPRMEEVEERNPNVHAGHRDQKTSDAIEKLWVNTGAVSPAEIEAAYAGFLGYLAWDYRHEVSREIDRLDAQALRARLGPIGATMSESQMKARLKAEIPGQVDKIIHALSGPGDNLDWGSLISVNTFRIPGGQRDIDGKELLARLWRFSESLTEPDQSAAKRGIASALLDSYTDYLNQPRRVCNPGKAQRLCIAVLQGRLAGVSIDAPARTRPTKEQSIQIFFQKPWIQGIKGAKVLKIAACRFCYDNPDVDREPFLEEVDQIAEAL